MSALTEETMHPIRSTPTPEHAEKLRKQAERILGRPLPPVATDRPKRSA
ncbi:hypothetical protein ACFWU5_11545 [Nocardia sp. NPDC058640]